MVIVGRDYGLACVFWGGPNPDDFISSLMWEMEGGVNHLGSCLRVLRLMPDENLIP